MGPGPAVAGKLLRWSMAEKFGWTLDYIDSLPLGEIHEFIAIEEGRDRAHPPPKPQKGRRK